MSAVTTRTTAPASLFAAPAFTERVLLSIAGTLEVTARRRMQRRQRDAERLARGGLDPVAVRRAQMIDAYHLQSLR